MKICIKENEFNPSFISMYGEEKAKELGYAIFEVPQGYEDCAFEDFDNNGFNIELYNKRKQSYSNQQKLSELKNWFNNDYTTYEQMLVRRKTLGIEDTIVDEFRNKTYHNLIELYEESEKVAKEIKELRRN